MEWQVHPMLWHVLVLLDLYLPYEFPDLDWLTLLISSLIGHVYMGPEVNWNWFENSLQSKISLQLIASPGSVHMNAGEVSFSQVCNSLSSKWSKFQTVFRSSCPDVFCKKDVLGNFTRLTRKHLCQSRFFNKVASCPATLLKKRLWHR